MLSKNVPASLSKHLQKSLSNSKELVVRVRTLYTRVWFDLRIRLIDLVIALIRLRRRGLGRQIRKYYFTAIVSWENGLVYRLNFVMWRFRMVIQTLSLYFLWLAVTSNSSSILGYSQEEILTYTLISSILVAFVFSSRSIDAQAEISNGNLNNYLVKPINYFAYWLSRDFSDKALNFLFSIAELGLIFLILRPPLVIAESFFAWITFLVAIILSTSLYFIFSFCVSMTTFWYYQNNGWAQRFLVFVVLQTLGGGLFPLDMLPALPAKVLSILPSAFFVYFPLQVYLERLTPTQVFGGLIIQSIWMVIFYIIATRLWSRGLKIYGAYGR